MKKSWSICACLQFVDGELVDKQHPFASYNIEAPTAEKAVEKLKKDFSCCDVTVYGKPALNAVDEEEEEGA